MPRAFSQTNLFTIPAGFHHFSMSTSLNPDTVSIHKDRIWRCPDRSHVYQTPIHIFWRVDFFALFGGLMFGEEIGIDQCFCVRQGFVMINSSRRFSRMHDVVVKLLLTTNNKGEPTNLAAHFTVFALVSMILWSCWGKIDDVISIVHFVGHFTHRVSQQNLGLAGLPGKMTQSVWKYRTCCCTCSR